MRENQLPVHYTSAEETGRVRPAVDSGDGGVHIQREPVAHVEARPAGNYPADDLSNSVQITLAKRVIKPGSDKAMCLAAQTSIPISDGEISSVSNLALKSADGTKVALSLSFFNDEAAQNVTPTHFSAAGSASAASASKLGTWLLASVVISVTTYTICNPKWVPSCVVQTVKISKQLSADIKTRASTPFGGTAVADTATAGAGTVASSGAHRTSDRDETGTRDNSRRHTHNDNYTARSNAGDSWSGGGMLPALSPQSKPIMNNPMDFMNQGFNQGFTSPATEMPKAAEAKTSKLKKTFMVPPPPPTPCVLPPAFGFFPMQPAQQDAAAQQQLQQAQSQASPETDDQSAARENTPQQLTAAAGRTEGTQSAALVVANQELQAADQELQAALRSSLVTVDEWRR
jgi:hypothetical protein